MDNKNNIDMMKSRIQNLLTADRLCGSAQVMEDMKEDIFRVLRHYADIDEEKIEIRTVQDKENVLMIQVPVRSYLTISK